jgi:hypothetical protein
MPTSNNTSLLAGMLVLLRVQITILAPFYQPVLQRWRAVLPLLIEGLD